MSEKLILVGRVAGAFGVKGEVRITTFTADPLGLAAYGPLFRKDGSAGLTLTSARAAKGGVIARTREIATPEEADRLRGLELFVPREALPEPDDEDEFYLTDLVGLPDSLKGNAASNAAQRELAGKLVKQAGLPQQ
mgnify:CR=1 FL=1